MIRSCENQVRGDLLIPRIIESPVRELRSVSSGFKCRNKSENKTTLGVKIEIEKNPLPIVAKTEKLSLAAIFAVLKG